MPEYDAITEWQGRMKAWGAAARQEYERRMRAAGREAGIHYDGTWETAERIDAGGQIARDVAALFAPTRPKMPRPKNNS